ncbi:MAG: hypothetical protein K0S74_554 [Chlamydiales bacterium]|jgi:hypothetical protein|nr:hypothetical protein [Chlamydiales bacterium]
MLPVLPKTVHHDNKEVNQIPQKKDLLSSDQTFSTAKEALKKLAQIVKGPKVEEAYKKSVLKELSGLVGDFNRSAMANFYLLIEEQVQIIKTDAFDKKNAIIKAFKEIDSDPWEEIESIDEKASKRINDYITVLLQAFKISQAVFKENQEANELFKDVIASCHDLRSIYMNPTNFSALNTTIINLSYSRVLIPESNR